MSCDMMPMPAGVRTKILHESRLFELQSRKTEFVNARKLALSDGRYSPRTFYQKYFWREVLPGCGRQSPGVLSQTVLLTSLSSFN
jgi:hypothetical protein